MDLSERWVLALARIAFIAACLLAVAQALTPDPRLPFGLVVVDKAQHFVAFYALALLAPVAFPALPAWLGVLGVLGLGAGVEVAQALPGVARDASWLDLVANVAGAACAGVPLIAAHVRTWLRSAPAL